jgi:LPS sulfotransferase NodH
MKFVILSQARTGSSLLAEMLNSHSLVQCDGEIFNPKTIQKKWGKIGLLIAKQFPQFIVWYNYRKRNKEHYGFKLILGQVPDVHGFIQSLYEKGFVIINLRRQDIIQTAFSACIAKQSGLWYINKDQSRVNESIVINTEVFFHRIEHAELQNQLQDELIARKNYIDVVYEIDLLDKHKQAAFSPRICERLSIPIELLKAISIKTHERDLLERVSNYNELITKIKESRFAQYIDAL